MQPESSLPPPKKPDIESFRRAQEAIKAANRGERLPAAISSKSPGAVSIATVPEKKLIKPFDATGRLVAVHRAVSLLKTMTEYYGITVGDIDDEEKRLHQMTDERLRGATKAYEFASNHVLVLVKDDKAREVAISKDPKISRFYDSHGVSEDELSEKTRQRQIGKRNTKS